MSFREGKCWPIGEDDDSNILKSPFFCCCGLGPMSLTLLLGPLDAEDPILQAFFVGDMVGKDSFFGKMCESMPCCFLCYLFFIYLVYNIPPSWLCLSISLV